MESRWDLKDEKKVMRFEYGRSPGNVDGTKDRLWEGRKVQKRTRRVVSPESSLPWRNPSGGTGWINFREEVHAGSQKRIKSPKVGTDEQS